MISDMVSYPSSIAHRKRSVLPPELQIDLQRLGASLQKAQAEAADVAAVVDGFSTLPVRDFKAAAGDIMACAALYALHDRDKWTTARARIALTGMISRLERTYGLEFVFLFHGNGYYRQAALELIEGPLEAPFLLASVIYRLNDWVPEVRRAAFECALRVFSGTPAHVVVPAVVGMLEMRWHWNRGLSEAVIVDEVLSRPDVQAGMTNYLLRTPAGPVARTLRNLLRDTRFDMALPSLASHARHPAVRRLAFETLIGGQARWPIGTKTEWIDKSMNIGRRVMAFDSRPVQRETPATTLIRQGAGDTSAIVRKVAMQAIVDRPDQWDEFSDLIDILSRDKSGAIRDGMAFIDRCRSRK